MVEPYRPEAHALGPLAAALAKAQMAFPTIVRDKRVTVTSKKTGGSYSFTYAPLDSILAAVRAPLAANGLVLVQMLDGGHLVTTLLHDSGGFLSGRVELPMLTDDIQGLGSAITYLRRYAIQAVLGIAAEDDDDGNRAAGNRVVSADVEHGDDGSLIGMAEAGDKQSSDFQVRQTPDGPVLGFRLRGDKGGILVEAHGPLALALDTHREAVIDHRVTVWGVIAPRTFTPKAKAGEKAGAVTYQVLAADRVRVPDVGDLPDGAPQPTGATRAPGGLTEEQEAELQQLAF